MALLLKDREGPTEAPAQSPNGAVAPAAPDFACETCGAALQRGQDWCLECGSAAPGRLGARPGWRAAFTVVGLSTLLLVCAVVAAYAALTSDAERTASAPATGSGAPITAQAPGAPAPGPAQGTPVQPGVTGPGVTAPTPPAGGASPARPVIPATRPPQAAPNRPVAPAPSAGTAKKDGAQAGDPASGGSTGTGTATDAAAPAAPVDIALTKGAAQTYDPIKRAGAEFGPAQNAVDDDPGTVWDVVVPADGQPIAAGLVIDLGKPYALRSLRITTPTDGFTVEVYGAKSAKQLPADVIDKRWIHLTDGKSVNDDDPIVLKGKGDGVKVQLVLLHFTAPADPTDPRVAIGDVALRGAP